MINYQKYTNIELIEFEKELGGKSFKDYMIEQGAWVVNGKYKNGAVRNPNKYIMLNEKFECLQMLRHKRQKARKYEQEDNEARAKLAGKMSVEPIQTKTQKPMDKPNPEPEPNHITEEQKETLRQIEF